MPLRGEREPIMERQRIVGYDYRWKPRTSGTQTKHFGILIDGVPADRVGCNDRHTIDVQVVQPTLALGWVPFYTEHDARIRAGYTIPEWKKLSPFDRAKEVALYRISSALNYAKGAG